MSKPNNKEELLAACDNNFDTLWRTIESLDDNQKNESFKNDGLNKNIRDVVCHLYHWQLMFLNWYKIGMKGQKPDMPFKGYKWKDIAKFNIVINEKYKNTNLKDAQKLLKSSHAKVKKIINKHSNQELFEKKLFDWTGTTSLGAYLISNSSSHYNWAMRVIKKGLKSITPYYT
jgi:hypothetical protein